MNDNLLKNISLFEELESSIKLIQLGFGEYQNLDMANDFYYLPFQLISSGFERLMKCYICLGHIESQGDYPNSRLFKIQLKHDLIDIKKYLIDNYFKTEGRHALNDDLMYISEDGDLHILLNYLSEFGKFARYHNLDIVTGDAKPSIDVKTLWQEYETNLLLNDKALMKKFGKLEAQDEVLGTITRMIIIKLERFVRALARQFTLGNLGQIALQYSHIVYPFLMLQDDELGTTDYRKQTTTYKENISKPYKRTLLDEVERKTNKNYVSKKINRKDYKGEWPFCKDEVVIECREKNWCIVSIDGYDYALNGLAKGRYKLEGVHEAGMAILGVSIGPFVDMALEFGKASK